MPKATVKLTAATAGAAELLLAELASVDADKDRLERRSKELRQQILGLFVEEGATSYRSVWGLVTVSQTVSYTYSDAIVAAEINLKAQRETERKLGTAKVAETKPVLKVTYSK